MRETKVKNEKGITLIALVVTIIVLLILASASINLVIGENGIITKAKEAKQNFQLAAADEKVKLNSLLNELNTKIASSNSEETVEFTIKHVNSNQTFTFHAYENETWKEWFTRKQGNSDLNSLIQAESSSFFRGMLSDFFAYIPNINDAGYNSLCYGDATDGEVGIRYNDGSYHVSRSTDIISSSLAYQLYAN